MKQVDWLAETCRLDPENSRFGGGRCWCLGVYVASIVRHKFSTTRDKDQDEVDIIVEGEGGDVVGIEVKAVATVLPAISRGSKAVCGLRQGFQTRCRPLRR